MILLISKKYLKIYNIFEKGIVAKCNANYIPRSTFISSINKKLLTKLVALPDRYSMNTYLWIFMFIIKFYCRYVTTVTLIRFANVTSTITPSSRRDADKRLALAMKDASHGVATIIKLGKLIIDDEESLDQILNRLKEILPSSTRQWNFTSYALLLHSTFKVCTLYISAMVIRWQICWHINVYIYAIVINWNY